MLLICDTKIKNKLKKYYRQPFAKLSCTFSLPYVLFAFCLGPTFLVLIAAVPGRCLPFTFLFLTISYESIRIKIVLRLFLS